MTRTVEEVVLSCCQQLHAKVEPKLESRLAEDLGFDFIDINELGMDVEDELEFQTKGLTVEDAVEEWVTVQDVVNTANVLLSIVERERSRNFSV
jgi:acyl carrier protein